MKRLVLTTFVSALCASSVLAMPTQAELKKAQPLVAELMAPTMADFKAAGTKDKAAAAVKVADKSVGFANSAETEAAKFLLLKGAVNFYTRGEEYDKAADTVAALQANVKDVTPEVIAEITGKATGKISETKAPRLFAQYRAAKLQVRAVSEAKTLVKKLKTVKSDALQRRYAEALAVSGNWKAAYGEFAKLSDAKLKAVVDAEAKGQAKNAVSGEFWWTYKPDFEDAEDIFKAHAAAFYRKALDAGEITGLKKNIVEQRIKDAGTSTIAVVNDGNSGESKAESKTPTAASSSGSGKAWQEKGNTAWLDLGERGKLEFVKCPAGSVKVELFNMGESARVQITRPFWFLKHELRWKQAAACPGIPCGNSDDKMRGTRKMDLSIGRYLTSEYEQDLPKGYVVRLPTLAELTYAFHANTKDRKDPYYDLTRGPKREEIYNGKPNAWGIDQFDWCRIEDCFDRTMFSNAIKTDEGRFPVTLYKPQETTDPLYWTESETRYHVWFMITCRCYHALKIGKSCEGDFGPQTRLVVGPDLVSEWKAKHVKK